ncbi:MAG TPA: hypothetical protein VJL57_01615 [Candidatus Paceibacterota bacterium]
MAHNKRPLDFSKAVETVVSELQAVATVTLSKKGSMGQMIVHDTGYGLFIAKQSVDAHGGHIRAVKTVPDTV